jgi:ankyrin repeat protein
MHAILEIGADLNAPGARRHRPLCVAARTGKLDIVKWLVEHGADPQLPDCRGPAIDQARNWNKRPGVLEYLPSVIKGATELVLEYHG